MIGFPHLFHAAAAGKARAVRMVGIRLEFHMKIKILAAVFGLLAAPAFAEDLVFTLINDSSQPLSNLYVSLPESAEWGDDILGVDVLAVGETGTVTIAGGSALCSYDLQFVMENAATMEGTANLCETNTFTLTD